MLFCYAKYIGCGREQLSLIGLLFIYLSTGVSLLHFVIVSCLFIFGFWVNDKRSKNPVKQIFYLFYFSTFVLVGVILYFW